ncbi:MAG TPA: class I SAM-dependent methyltransferase [Alphaproteobacteria bacterium]|nr:class I SAM-dependent methyltransferase [Alphaproteobacteria bacterium]
MSHYLSEMAAQGYNAETIGPFHRFMMPWLMETHGVRKDASILDIGAGQGHASIPLDEAGWRSITVVDIDDLNFPMFRERFGFRALRCDIVRDPLPLADDSVDAAICLHVIEHLERTDHFLAEARRVLKVGAPFFVVTPDWRKTYIRFWDDPTHVRPYDKISIVRLLRMAGFDVTVHSWNSRYGTGRFQAYRLWPRLGMIGTDMMAIARKPAAAAGLSATVVPLATARATS